MIKKLAKHLNRFKKIISKHLISTQKSTSIYDINYKKLKEDGIEGLIFDLDGTILKACDPNCSLQVYKLFSKLESLGFKSCLVSNNTSFRVNKVAEYLDTTLYVNLACKPFPAGFKKAMQLMQTNPTTTAVIGNSLFADILGAKISGINTSIKVDDVGTIWNYLSCKFNKIECNLKKGLNISNYNQKENIKLYKPDTQNILEFKNENYINHPNTKVYIPRSGMSKYFESYPNVNNNSINKSCNINVIYESKFKCPELNQE